MQLRSLLSIPFGLATLFTRPLPLALARNATTMSVDSSKLNVLHGELQPHTSAGDSTHPTGFQRDGYCWGSDADPGQHFVGAVVSKEFLEFSKDRGNDLMSPGGRFPGLKDGCRWCLCVNRWKEAFLASDKLGEKVVPKVDLSSTALDTLRTIKLEDLRRFEIPARTGGRDEL